jgi:hypothetical protein
MEVGGQHLVHLTSGKEKGTHFTGGLAGPRAGLFLRKISSSPRFDPWPVQPVTSRYTDCSTRPTKILCEGENVYLPYSLQIRSGACNA